MICPKCENRNFEPSDDVKKPLHNMGNKQYYKTFDTRNYVCLDCGFKFQTKEEYFRPLRSRDQKDLFED